MGFDIYDELAEARERVEELEARLAEVEHLAGQMAVDAHAVVLAYGQGDAGLDGLISDLDRSAMDWELRHRERQERDG